VPGQRILVVTWGSFGDLNPHLALAVALADRGHEVPFAPAEFSRPRVEPLGLRFLPIHPALPDWRAEPGLVTRMMDPSRGTERLVKELVFPALRETFADVAPAAAASDLVVTSLLAVAARLAAEARGVPWASTALQPSVFLSESDPPTLLPVPGADRLRGLPPAGRRALLRGMDAWSASWAAPVAAFRRELGMPPDAANPLLAGQHSPLLTLALFSPILGPPQPDWPAGVRLCGFPFDDRVDGTHLPHGLARFLDAGTAPVVFTLGSAAALEPGRFFDESVLAARALNRRAVLLAGPDAVTGLVHRDPDVWSEPWAHHRALFPRAAAVVHQGGIGTLSQAMRAGVPMLVVPHAHDQPDNARRAVELGVARSLPASRYRAERAAAAISALLADPAYAVRARELARPISAERGGQVAAGAIGRMLGDG